MEFEREYRVPSERRREHVSHNKKQRCTYTDRPSLLQLCMRQAAFNLPQIAHKLQFLPTDLSIPLLQDFLRRVPAPSVKELEVFCKAISYTLQNLSLCGLYGNFSRGIQHISILPNLVRLDFRGCAWLLNLDFLSALKCLECLNLRGCYDLKTEALLHIQDLPQLQCLDVGNVPAMTDYLALHTISELTCLRALNVSGTCVGDYLVEVLTYGSRLRTWASQQEEARVKDLKLVIESGQHGVQTLLSQYPVSNLTYFRLQGTDITDAAIAHLLAIPDLLLLDVRECKKVTGRPLSSLRAKHKLIALPNNARLAARTNAMLAGVMEGECGCRAMARQSRSSDKVTDEFTELCQQAFIQLVQKPRIDSELEYSVFRNR